MPRRIALALLAIVVAFVVGNRLRSAGAEIEGGTFSSKADNVRATVPRGWRVSDQPSYPGVILRMFRTKPHGTLLLAVDPIPTIEVACQGRPSVDGAPPADLPLATQIACHQAKALEASGFTVGPIKEAARPWFDYESSDRMLRQGVVVLGETVATLVLASDTNAGRAQYNRTFDKVLRSIRDLVSAGTGTGTGSGTATVAPDAGP
jgi:hypothetical protein